MRRGVARLTVFIIAAALAGLAAPVAAASRHSGTVISVDPNAGRLVVEEMLQGTTTRKVNVRVGPDTRMVLSERLPDAEVTDLRHPFKDRPISLADIHPGDGVTVELTAKDAPASALTVTLPAGR
jgi:threonine dehydrogenase-like Zn-dependent dehydrogenase